MKRLVGFDLNGWNDFSVRNWVEVAGQETSNKQKRVIHGGIGSVVVQVENNGPQPPKFIGGVQALRAPHGRGAGWGRIGTGGNRKALQHLLEHPQKHISEITSAICAMAGTRKATVVLAIPDTPTLDEDHQEALLKSLQSLRSSRRLLVWRPVLAVLAALDQCVDIQWDNINSIGVIGHTSKGFTSQRLELRKDKRFAPERKNPGQSRNSALGLESLLRQAKEALKQRCANPHKSAHVEASQLPWMLALGHHCEAEPLRKWDGSWEIVTPPAGFVGKEATIPKGFAENLANCDAILFETPTIGAVRHQVVESLEMHFDRKIYCLKPQAIALGAWEAARRLSENLPIYYDFLPQISTIVQNVDGAKNFDLIPADTLLPAGQSYRSRQPARLALMSGMEKIKVYLKKETDETPRRAIVPLSIPPRCSTPVELHLQQTPASGRARLTLISEAFAGPLVVDWEQAEELGKSWEEIIKSLEPEKPTVPNRVVLRCGIEPWSTQNRIRGLEDLLEQELDKDQPNWKVLAGKLAGRLFEKYPISSDGNYPDNLSDKAKSLLESAISRAEKDVRKRLRGYGTNTNDSLKFLTWSFHKCPEYIVPHLLDGVEADTGTHPFVQSGGSKTLMLQGVGRTARDPQHQRRVFDYLLRLPRDKWKKNQIACAAFLLSRTDSAPAELDREEINIIASVAEAKVLEAVKALEAGSAFTSAYIYGPYLLVGLLRWRLCEPWALVIGRDNVADRLKVATEKLKDHLPWHMVDIKEVLEDVCKELEGKGNNPDILLDLEGMILKRN